jgi:hypothetical protein
MSTYHIDFNKYKIEGERILHSGLKSNLFYDFKLLKKKENIDDLNHIVYFLKKLIPDTTGSNRTLVGIWHMGGYIAKLVNDKSIVYFPRLNKLSEPLVRCIGFEEPYILFDDVGSTFGTIKKAIGFIGYVPVIIFVILNRVDINNGINCINMYNNIIPVIELKPHLEVLC